MGHDHGPEFGLTAVLLTAPNHQPNGVMLTLLEGGFCNGKWIPCVVKVDPYGSPVASNMTENPPASHAFIVPLQDALEFRKRINGERHRYLSPCKKRTKKYGGYEGRDAQKLSGHHQRLGLGEGGNHGQGEPQKNTDEESGLNPGDQADAFHLLIAHVRR